MIDELEKTRTLKVVSFDASADDDFAHNLKNLEDFVKEYKEQGGRGYVALRIDRNGESVNNIFTWHEGQGMHVVGALEVIKGKIIKNILSGDSDD